MKPYSEEKGIQYLTALVRAQFDPDAAEPPLPGTKTNQKSNEPRTIPELRQQMAQRLAEKIPWCSKSKSNHEALFRRKRHPIPDGAGPSAFNPRVAPEDGPAAGGEDQKGIPA